MILLTQSFYICMLAMISRYHFRFFYINCLSSRYDGLQAAKQLARNLIETLQQELIQFQQMNPPMTAIQYSAAVAAQQSTVVQQQQQQTQMYSQQQGLGQPMAVPPPMMAIPPPLLQTVPQNATTVNYIQQPPPSASAAQQQQQQVQQTQQLMQQATGTVITQSVPIQIHQQAQPGNVMQAMSNVSLPPPGVSIPMKAGLVQIQAAPPPHLSQPPPNLQLQPQPTTTQIVLNQAPQAVASGPPQATTSYQYQYIHAQPQDPQQVSETWTRTKLYHTALA